jgi:nicotinamidase-related amidase
MAHAQQSAEGALIFGKNYAVLNVDLMTILIDPVKDTTEGQTFISNCSRWNDAVHKKHQRPLTIFTSLFFSRGEPELTRGAPFTKLVKDFGSFASGSPGVQIASSFTVDERDIVLQKTRWYAGAGNSLEQILNAQNIDTVVIVCHQFLPYELG